VKKQTLTLSLLAVFAMIMISAMAFAGDGCPYSAAKEKAKTTAAVATDKDAGEKIVLNVSNMSGDACARHVTKALSEVDGVNGVSVNIKEGKAEVMCDASKVKKETLTAAVVKAGYPAEMMTQTTDAAVKKNAKDCAKTCASVKKGCKPTDCGMKTASSKGSDDK